MGKLGCKQGLSTVERIDMNVDKSSGCWVWQGYLNADNYGNIKVAGIMKKVHRVSWEVFNGPIPEGICVCHTCDNPPCVNPEHLFLGTRLDNMKDQQKKGRHDNTKKTHCKQGHLFNETNTRYYMYDGHNHRVCRVCDRLRQRGDRRKT